MTPVWVEITVLQHSFAGQESSEQGRDIPSAAPGTQSCEHLREATSATAKTHQENTQAHVPLISHLSSPFLLPPDIVLTVAVGIRWAGECHGFAF